MGHLTYTEHDGFAFFSDGTVLPMVRGGSDAPVTEAPPAAPEPAPAAPAPEPSGPARGPDGKFAPSPAAGQAPDEPSFAELAAEYEALAGQPGETVTLPKDKIGKWNSEHKNYRERFQPYERAFKGLHEDDQRDILAFVEALNDETARPQAVQWMRNVLDRLTPAQQQQMADAVQHAQATTQTTPPAAPPTEEDFDPFDTAQIDARIARTVEQRLAAEREAREQAEAVKEEERRIQERAKALGYTDPNSDEYALLLLKARKSFANDPDPLGRAHEAIEATFNARATEILKAKRADAQAVTTPPEGAAPSGHKEVKTMDDAAVSARQRLDSILGPPS